VRVDDEIGEVKLFGLSARLSRTPGEVTSASPRLGARTDEVLGALGCTREEIAALRKQGIV